MGLKSFQARPQDILAKESPSHVSTPPDRSLDQNENNGKATLNCTTSSSLPPLTESAVNGPVPSMVRAYSTPPQNMPQYRNVFNDRARRDFCYWLVEKRGSMCKGYSFGAYKTSLGLPKV